jgi:2'-5' RNA ligase
MKRTFIAVPISEETKNLLNTIRSEIPNLRMDVKLAKPKNSHITLKFLGDTEKELIPNIIENISETIREVREFEFICEGIGVFPNPSRPRVLWIGISEGADRISNLSSKIETSLTKLGFSKESREFHPHITVGRVRRNKRFVKELDQFLSFSFSPIVNNVDKIVYLESKLTKEGPIYTPISAFKLKSKENING